MTEYAKCEKCGEGVLLPFFDESGKNMYGCTKCGSVLYLLSFGKYYLTIGKEKFLVPHRVVIYSEKAPEIKKE